MELDQYPITEVEDQTNLVESLIPSTALHYSFVQRDGDMVNLLPITNLIITDNIQISLNHLRKIQGDDLTPIDLSLRELYRQFKSNKRLNPIQVRQVDIMASPSPNDSTLPSIFGQGSAMALPLLLSTDYLYQIIGSTNEQLVTMSIYFKYDYIPVELRF